jgi:predicted PurR-regulated permease PerM
MAEEEIEELADELVTDGWRSRWPPMSYWVRVAITVILTMYVLGLANSVLNILILVLISAVLAIGLDPAVRRLVATGMRRGVAVALIFLAFVVFVFLFGLLVVPPLAHQVTGLADDIPAYSRDLSARHDWIGSYFREHDVTASVKTFIETLPDRIRGSFHTILGVAGRVGSVLFNIITVAILTIYFMLSLPSMRSTLALVFPTSRRDRAARVIDQSVEKIGGYVYGNVVTSIICGVAALVALLLLGVPFAVPLAMWAGLADLIPAVGSYLGAVPAILVAFFVSPLRGLVALAYFVAYQQFENYVLVPRVMKNAVNLSPAAVIISTLIGGSLYGFAGALLALPVAATVKVVIVETWLRDRGRKGDTLAKAHVEAEMRADAEVKADARERAAQRRRLMERLRSALRRSDDAESSEHSEEPVDPVDPVGPEEDDPPHDHGPQGTS